MSRDTNPHVSTYVIHSTKIAKTWPPKPAIVGGSSSINAMLYVRGHRWDYDHWASLGNDGWSYDEVLKYFRKAEHNEVFDDHYHGQNGPLNVCKIRNQVELYGSSLIQKAVRHSYGFECLNKFPQTFR